MNVLLASILSAVFVFGDTAFVDSLTKCGVNDYECQTALFTNVLKDIAKTGVKELAIPPFDPYELKNVSVPLFGLVDLTLVEGVARGIRDCKIHSLVADIPNVRYSIDATCDITVKGHYKAFSSSSIVKSLFGGDFIHGDGFGKIKANKIHVKLGSVLIIYKDADGEVYLKATQNETKYDFEILGDITFYATNLLVANEDVSDIVVQLLNQNGKAVAPIFGRSFVDIALKYFYLVADQFYERVPARYYFKEDLTPFITS